MELSEAIRALGALAHDSRLAVFRLLMHEGPAGLTAGTIAERLHIPASTLSHHLALLERAGLLTSRREQRQIYYAADLAGTRQLLTFLTEECCGGRPEVCEGLSNLAAPSAEENAAPDEPFNVLFLCTGNSARSIMAEAILNRLGEGRFRAYSAGSHPAGAVNPIALDILESLDYPTGHLRSKSWDEFAGPEGPEMDFVFTVCNQAAGEICPVWPGQPMTAHWAFPDPATFEGTDVEKRVQFLDVFRQIERSLTVFASLPLTELDRLALQNRLDEIGEDRGAPG